MRDSLTKLNWNKCKGTTGKFEPKFLVKEKFSFQRATSTALSCHDILDLPVLNICQIPLACISPGKYSFSSKGATNLPIKGANDKWQITATFAVILTGSFLPMHLIYTGKTRRC